MTKQRTTALEFPEAALLGSLGDLARVLAAGTEVPPEFCFAAALTVLGSICGTELKLNVGCKVEPRLYTILVGGSYDAKKSSALRKVEDFFAQTTLKNKAGVERKLYAIHGVGSAEGLARELKAHPDALLSCDELKALVEKFRVQGSVLLGIVTSLFENDRWQNATKKSAHSLCVDGAHLSIVACCTLDTLSDVWSRDAIAIGLPNRFFIVNADRKTRVAWASPPDEAQLTVIRERLKEQFAKLPMTLEITPDAKAAWETWYANLRPSEHVKRLDTIGLRLLLLLALTTDKEVVDVEIVRAVTAILDYEFLIRVETDPIDADNKIAGLESKIRRQLQIHRDGLTERELRRRTHGDRAGLWAFNAAMKNLANAGDIERRGDLYFDRPASPVLSPTENAA